MPDDPLSRLKALDRDGESFLEQISKIYTHFPHSLNILTQQARVSIDKWLDKGRPYLWYISKRFVHGKKVYCLYEDAGHGYVALCVDNILVVSGDPIFNLRYRDILVLADGIDKLRVYKEIGKDE